MRAILIDFMSALPTLPCHWEGGLSSGRNNPQRVVAVDDHRQLALGAVNSGGDSQVGLSRKDKGDESVAADGGGLDTGVAAYEMAGRGLHRNPGAVGSGLGKFVSGPDLDLEFGAIRSIGRQRDPFELYEGGLVTEQVRGTVAAGGCEENRKTDEKDAPPYLHCSPTDPVNSLTRTHEIIRHLERDV